MPRYRARLHVEAIDKEWEFYAEDDNQAAIEASDGASDRAGEVNVRECVEFECISDEDEDEDVEFECISDEDEDGDD